MPPRKRPCSQQRAHPDATRPARLHRSVFNIMCITQADTEQEGKILLARMGWRAPMPARLWVYASLLTGASLMVWILDLVEVRQTYVSCLRTSPVSSDSTAPPRGRATAPSWRLPCRHPCVLAFCLPSRSSLLACPQIGELYFGEALVQPSTDNSRKMVLYATCGEILVVATYLICVPPPPLRVSNS
jgi:hypothetical protein